MADIDIQKKRNPVWPWILGVVILIALIWALMTMFGERQERAAEPAPAAAPATTVQPAPVAPPPAAAAPGTTAPAAVREYAEYVQKDPPQPAMAADHEYTATGLRRLIAALEASIQQAKGNEQPLQQRLAGIRDRADQITRDPGSTEHARLVREAFLESSLLIEELRQRRAPEQPEVQQRVAAARSAAEAIDPQVVLLNQKDPVRRFFNESAAALARLQQ